jgi:hypothetical protein
MSEKKLPNGMKLVFAPGCFDNFEGTQEELDALVKEIEQGFEDGSFFEKATPVDMDAVDDMDDEKIQAIMKLLDFVDNNGSNRKLN